jgi:hypothetical protein
VKLCLLSLTMFLYAEKLLSTSTLVIGAYFNLTIMSESTSISASPFKILQMSCNLRKSSFFENVSSVFNRSRFLNYKTRVVFKIFSNTNILSEILINSESIRGAPQYTKCGGCREYYGNNINKFGKKQFSSLKRAKTFQKK